MKTQRIARCGERTFSKSGRMKETCKQIVLDQRLLQFFSEEDLKAFRNSGILPSMLLTSNRNGSS